MELRKTYISEETANKFFPMLKTFDTFGKINLKYLVIVSALKIQGRKTFLSLHISATKQTESNEMICQYLALDVPCVRASLDKPMRTNQRDLIYFEAKKKLTEKIAFLNLPLDHPYRLTVEAM